MGQQPFWTTDEGVRLKDQYRFVSTLRLHLKQNPLTKATKGNNRKRELRDLMFRGAATWHRLEGAFGGSRWPRLRAEVVLDIALRTSLRDPARVDKYCKWLLDELGGTQGDSIVYHDDRQVKMLFARLDRSADEPSVWVSAQTVAEVHAGLRRVVGRDDSWTITEANPEYRWHGGVAAAGYGAIGTRKGYMKRLCVRSDSGNSSLNSMQPAQNSSATYAPTSLSNRR